LKNGSPIYKIELYLNGWSFFAACLLAILQTRELSTQGATSKDFSLIGDADFSTKSACFDFLSVKE
jgi:hypothetical protein